MQKVFYSINVICAWRLFVRASLHMRREEKPTKCHWMVYCTYNMLNMFRGLLCPSSGARDYMCVIIAYGVQCLVAGCRRSSAEQQAVHPGRGILHDCSRATSLCLDAQPAASTWPPPTSNQALLTIGGSNKHIVSSSWCWAWKCTKHFEHIISAIKHSVTSRWFLFSTHMQRCTDKYTSRNL